MTASTRAAAVAAAEIMDAFLERTGVTSIAPPRRYLWTDAFAVCNCLALHAVAGTESWLEHARRLIRQVHHVLGRHRADDARTGWVSGLSDAQGEQHPTAGGLRIGKPLPERDATTLPDDRVDWDRDGQYYHYVTRWMHALERAAAATADAMLLQWGVELALAAHAAFVHDGAGEKRIYWKMSVDLSRPVVTTMGQHDALDGLVATAGLALRSRTTPHAAAPAALEREIGELVGMCTGRGWATTDALGIGGLLVDALALARLDAVVPGAQSLLTRVLHDAGRSLDLVTTARYLDGPADHRLPFRELGLSLGLAAVDRLAHDPVAATLHDGARTALERLRRHVPLRARIESFWLEPRHQRADTWTEHEDINAVMLATSLLPEGYLSD